MRTPLCLIAIIVLGLSCFSCQQPKGELPFIDVSKNYPQKEILLTDIAEVSYLHLSTDDNDYLHNGYIHAVSTNTLVIIEYETGNVLFFGKDGKPKSRFNRTGNGPGEYHHLHRVFYDEEADDVFVLDPHPMNIIRVYSSTGVYKRDFSLPEGTMVANDIVSFDNNTFIFYDFSADMKAFEDGPSAPQASIASYYLISKTDGAALDHFELSIPPVFIGMYVDGMRIPPPRRSRLLNSTEGVLLCSPESDTVFLYGKDRSLVPLIHKIPPVATLDPRIYLNNCVNMGNYQFMQVNISEPGWPSKHYIRNKKTGDIFEQKLLLPDYKGAEFTIGPASTMKGWEDRLYLELDITELQQAYSENRLSGKLKELVATLKEDDNNVYAIAHFK